ncbi:MAG: hypothetical protein JXR95_01270 [Deltaproteobacteria bacterium]|nr:hypothetical protein [Deltaproteobacteria bacterium]
MTGSTEGSLDSNSSSGSYDIFLTKYSADGTKYWTRQWGTSNYDLMDSGGNLAISSGDILYFAGYTDGALTGQTNAGGYDVFLIGYTDW